MRLISKFIIFTISNVLAFLVAAYLLQLPGFALTKEPLGILSVAAVFALANIFIRPVLKLILGPIIVLTLGLGIILVNALLLFLVDAFSEYISITGLLPLIYATIVIGLVNLIVGFAGKRLYKE